ncbi:Uncharacterised protein [Sphingobacterium daejeonense]|nr:Uncharacterised protein [Sphingobacterium daejeonense]
MLQIKLNFVALRPGMELSDDTLQIFFVYMRIDLCCCDAFMS